MNAPLALSRPPVLGTARLGGILLLCALLGCAHPGPRPDLQLTPYYEYCEWKCDSLSREMGFAVEFSDRKECYCGKALQREAYRIIDMRWRPAVLGPEPWYPHRKVSV